jgi:hypothetical protein
MSARSFQIQATIVVIAFNEHERKEQQSTKPFTFLSSIDGRMNKKTVEILITEHREMGKASARREK